MRANLAASARFAGRYDCPVVLSCKASGLPPLSCWTMAAMVTAATFGAHSSMAFSVMGPIPRFGAALRDPLLQRLTESQ